MAIQRAVQQTTAPITVRLSPDDLHLEVRLNAESAAMDRADLVALIEEQSAALGVSLPLTGDEIVASLETCPTGSWARFCSATPPTPALNGRVELLVPVPVAMQGGQMQGLSHTVRTGTPLARLTRGASGQPGRDLLGRAIPARAPREARLPQGENTSPSKDGLLLVAACDGEVVLRDLLLHVQPAGLHRGDLTAAHGPLRAESGVFVTGTVQAGARIDAAGNVHIQGDVRSAQIVSRQGCISIGGDVSGTAAQRSELYAAKDITCQGLVHAGVVAMGDLLLHKGAWFSTIKLGGNLVLRRSIESCLVDTHMEIGGAITVAVEAPAPLAAVPTERQHVRISAQMPAWIAPHGVPPVEFHGGVIEDISIGGARFRLKAPAAVTDPACGAIMQLKFAPSDEQGQILAIARVARVIAPGVLGLNFVQMTHRDRERLQKLCRQFVLSRQQTTLGTRSDRKRGE